MPRGADKDAEMAKIPEFLRRQRTPIYSVRNRILAVARLYASTLPKAITFTATTTTPTNGEGMTTTPYTLARLWGWLLKTCTQGGTVSIRHDFKVVVGVDASSTTVAPVIGTSGASTLWIGTETLENAAHSLRHLMLKEVKRIIVATKAERPRRAGAAISVDLAIIRAIRKAIDASGTKPLPDLLIAYQDGGAPVDVDWPPASM